MSTVVDELIYRIAADAAELRKELRQVEGDAKRTGKNAGAGLATMGGSMDRLTSQAKRLAGAVAAVFTVRAAFNFVKHAIDGADALYKLSQKTGAAVEELSLLRHAAELSDTSLEAIAKSLGFLSRGLFDARKGTGEQKDILKALGIQATDAHGRLRPALEVMIEVADVFAAMPDGADKSALALKLFGRAGADLIPLLNGGAAGLREMMEEARRLGMEIDTRTAQEAEEFNDNLTRLKGSAHGVAMDVARELVPALNQLFVAFNGDDDAATSFGTTLGGFLRETGADFLEWATYVGSELDKFANRIQKVEMLRRRILPAMLGGGGTKLSLHEVLDLMREAEQLDAAGAKIQADRERVLKLVERIRNASIYEAQRMPGRSTAAGGGNRLGDFLKRMAEASDKGKETKSKPVEIEDEYLKLLEQELELEKKLAEEREKQQRQSLEGQERQLEELHLRTLNTEVEKALWMTSQGRYSDWDDWAKRMFVANAKLIDQEVAKQKAAEEAAAAAKARMEEWNDFAVDAARTIKGTFADVVEAAGQGWDEVASRFGAALRRMIAEAAAAALFSKLFGPIASGYGKGDTGFAATFFRTLAGVGSRAGGGPIHGPGSETSDSVLIRASRGEYVMRAAAVRHYGQPLLDRMNRMDGIRLPRYADGGPIPIRDVPAKPLYIPPSGSAHSFSPVVDVHLKNINAWDSSVVRDEMAGSTGEKITLNHVRKNARAINQILRANG